MPAQAPKGERPAEDFGHAVAEHTSLVSPMKVAGHRLPWDQGKQDGTDREIYEGEFDKGFQREPPVQKASLCGTNVDELRTWYTANGQIIDRDRVPRKQPRAGTGVNAPSWE